jgi:hypothetical protein
MTVSGGSRNSRTRIFASTDDCLGLARNTASGSDEIPLSDDRRPRYSCKTETEPDNKLKGDGFFSSAAVVTTFDGILSPLGTSTIVIGAPQEEPTLAR